MRLNRLEISGFKSFPRSRGRRVRSRCHRDRRPERLRQEQRRGRHHVGARRAEREEPARRAHAGRDLQRQRRPEADRGGRSAAQARRRADAGRPRGRAAPDPALAPGAEEPDPATQLELPATEVRDVEIARRLYRSGESEYLVDGEVVRLARRPGPADGRWPRLQGLRRHRAGQDRADPQRQADRPAAADRGGRRRHQVPIAPPLGRTEARGGPAEPLARRRRDLRARPAARRRSSARRPRRGGTGACATRLRRWEKVLFARRYRALAQAIEAARARLAAARDAGERPPSRRCAELEQQLDITTRGLDGRGDASHQWRAKPRTPASWSRSDGSSN